MFKHISYSKNTYCFSDSDNDSCVASFIENGKKMTPIVKSCDVKLPVACRRDSSDPWNGTSRECVTSGNDIISTNSYITTNMVNFSGNDQNVTNSFPIT